MPPDDAIQHAEPEPYIDEDGIRRHIEAVGGGYSLAKTRLAEAQRAFREAQATHDRLLAELKAWNALLSTLDDSGALRYPNYGGHKEA